MTNFISVHITSCNDYTAKDYVDDLKELTEETAENASSYTKKEWKEMASELKKINAKLSNACKDLTDEQIREIKKLKKKLKKELADFDGDKLKEDLEEISIQVCETLEEILSE